MLSVGKKLAISNKHSLQRISLLAQQTNTLNKLSCIHSSFVLRSVSNVKVGGSFQSFDDKTTNNEDIQIAESSLDSMKSFADLGSNNVESSLLADKSSELLKSFADYGLGGYIWPSQLLQNLMEVLNVNIGLPWIATIMTTCVILRTIAIPFYAKMQVFHTKSHNCMPEQMRIQTEIAMCTNLHDKQRKQKELMDFMQKNGTNPILMLPYMMPTAIIFMSFFAAMRQMANVKLPSLTDGGTLWFTDLTVCDPTYILPVLVALSLHSLIRFGGTATVEGGGPMADNPMFKNILLYGPFAMIPFIMWQPSALFLFWITSNCYSFFQMRLFRNEQVRNYFNIPKKVNVSPAQQMLLMKKQQELMQSAFKKMKHHQEVMKKFSDDQKRDRN